MKETLWNSEGYKVLYTNLKGVAFSPTLKIFRIKYRTDYFRYKAICNKGNHKVGIPLYSKNVICIAIKDDPEDEPNKKYFIKGIKTCLKKTWDKPLIIPYMYMGLSPRDFKEIVLKFNTGNNIIHFIGL